MRLAKLAVASVSPTVGAVHSNVSLLIDIAREMAEADVTLAGIPRAGRSAGTHPRIWCSGAGFSKGSATSSNDLPQRHGRHANRVRRSASRVAVGGQLFNAAAIVHRGRILGFVPKGKAADLSTSSTKRARSRAAAPKLALDAGGVPVGDYIFKFDFGIVAIEVCEDAWSPDGPMRRRCYSGAEIVVNVSSSPYRMGIDGTRREMLATRAADNQTVLLYANAVGGQDGLDLRRRRSHLPERSPRARRAAFSRRVVVGRRRSQSHRPSAPREHDLAHRLRRLPAAAARRAGDELRRHDGRSAAARVSRARRRQLLPAGVRPSTADARDAALDDLFEALALGVKSYFEKTGAFRSLGIALSGGRDSMLTLLVAWRAAQLIGERRRSTLITAFYMPSRHSQAEHPHRRARARRRTRRRAAHRRRSTRRTIVSSTSRARC